jgi:hypothetical protein
MTMRTRSILHAAGAAAGLSVIGVALAQPHAASQPARPRQPATAQQRQGDRAAADHQAQEAPAEQTAITIYSTAQPGAIPPEVYRPLPGGTNYYNPYQNQPLPGYAVVKQERTMQVPGSGDIRFTDVASHIDPTTVTFRSLTAPQETQVLEQSYQFDLVGADKLLERFLDETITVEQVRGDETVSITGTLLSAAGGIILQDDAGRLHAINGYANIVFPDRPGGLVTRPTLVWDVASAQPGPQDVRVTYQTSGITWWADYNVVFTPGEDANSGLLDVGAWVSIINQSGATYNDAKLKLIAGDVHRAPQQPQPYPMMARGMVMDQAAAAPGFAEKAFFEYHLYTLGRPTTIPDNSTKQIELFEAARGVPADKVLVYYGLEGWPYGFLPEPAIDRNFGVQSNTKVDVYLRFDNDEESGLGIPLPSGRIRVNQLDPADDTLEFIGEDVIDHTPRDEEVLIKLGNAFDVVGERKQVDFRVDQDDDWMEETIEITLRNHKDEPVNVIVKENLYRWVNWTIKQSTHEYETHDSRTVHFPVTVGADGEATLRYTVRYTW